MAFTLALVIETGQKTQLTITNNTGIWPQLAFVIMPKRTNA